MFHSTTIHSADALDLSEISQDLSVEIHYSLADAEAIWRSFQDTAIATPYQGFDFINAWVNTIGLADRVDPVICILRMPDGRIDGILPFGAYNRGPVRVASWLGDQNMNYFMGLYRPGVSYTASEFQSILKAIAADAGIDGFFLKNQPHQWQRKANPAAVLATQESPSSAYCTALEPDFERHMQALPSGRWKRQLRTKTRKLASMGEVKAILVADKQEAHQAIATYFRQKKSSLAKQGVDSPFEYDDVRAFFRELIDRSTPETPLLQIYKLELDGEAIAIYAGTPGNGHFAASICSFSEGEHDAHSPGEQLLKAVVEDRCEKGDTSFDLGTGRARYKSHWCPEKIELFDTVAPMTLLGRIYARVAKSKRGIMRMIKEDDRLWNAFRALRQGLIRVKT